MPLNEATSCYTIPLATFAETLAGCAAFQEWTGAADAAAAELRIYQQGVPLPEGDAETFTLDEATALLPFVVVYLARFGRRKDAGGTSFQFGSERGQLEVYFYQLEQTPGKPPAEVERDFLNTVGTIIDQLEDAAGAGTGFAMTDHETDGITGVKYDEFGSGEIPLLTCHVTIQWGHSQ